MGNNLEKVFRDDEYEVTLRIKKVDHGGRGQQANGAANGNAEQTPAAEAMPKYAVPNGDSRARKSADDRSMRARKILKVGALDEANSSDSEQQQPLEEGATPRTGRYAGRKTSCMKWSNSGLDMSVLKSHLSPNFHVTVPPEFVAMHGSFFEISNGVQGKSLEIEEITKTRFKFKKQHWAQIVHEHNLQLNDTVHFEMEGKSKLRIEKGHSLAQYTPAEPSASPPPYPNTGPGGAELYSPGVTDSAGAATSGAATPAAAGVATATATAAAAAGPESSPAEGVAA
ncbi:hypothetical protein SELMODRAFT_445871 [Selaginella moellendorffii]|uniref:TF-B3 domain-containing protein n=1 Tax=Selaginella moellendorffii TaxID=88036 RepID=D8SLZ0_SELML|nr:uncharacterized protein LOC9644385 [Selaginella moellendorffii]EFJ14512.1 hypothetical protein SELMODRAFT_445871 [Selaginella moellendorffii]|eukprot:XP_002984462.1 uncharacterized protein LOC9644385 [Selaginella moellendorffii]